MLLQRVHWLQPCALMLIHKYNAKNVFVFVCHSGKRILSEKCLPLTGATTTQMKMMWVLLPVLWTSWIRTTRSCTRTASLKTHSTMMSCSLQTTAPLACLMIYHLRWTCLKLCGSGHPYVIIAEFFICKYSNVLP